MSAIEIMPRIYWVGAIDWNLRFCGSYNTPRGTTYNAYLIVDEKIALIDTVKAGFEGEMIARIKEVIDPSRIDYIISQHAEMDHSGAMAHIMKAAKNAKVIATQACRESLYAHFGTDWHAGTVKTGDSLSLGRNTLTFIQAQMLHWPDNMFTYIREKSMLFSNDAFGQHIATQDRYADEIGAPAIEEASKYFAVIVSIYSRMVQKKIKEIEDMNVDINMIAPAHGVIWRQPDTIISAYKRWSSGITERKVTIVFDTMWHSTEKMAGEIARGIQDKGVEARVYNLRTSDWSQIIGDIMESQVIAVGSPTLNMGIYPTVGGFLTFLKGIRPPEKKAVAFGSYGWGRGAVKAINEELKGMKLELLDEEGLEIRYVPNEEGLKACFEFGKRIAAQVPERKPCQEKEKR